MLRATSSRGTAMFGCLDGSGKAATDRETADLAGLTEVGGGNSKYSGNGLIVCLCSADDEGE